MSVNHQLLDLFTRWQRQANLEPLAEHTEEYGCIRLVRHDLRWGMIAYSQLSAASVDQAVAEQLRYFRTHNYMFEWKYYSYDHPADLPERLQAAGLIPQPREAVMVLDLQQAPPILTQPLTHDIRRMTSIEAVTDADAVHLAVWGDHGLVMQRARDAWSVDPDSLSIHVGYAAGIPVCYGRVEFSPVGNPFASIWGGATLPAFRRQGFYTALVASRLQEARRRACRYLVIDADPQTSMPILAKLGFVTIAYATAFEWEPATES